MVYICRFLPSVKQAWMDLVPGNVKSKACNKEVPLLVKPPNCVIPTCSEPYKWLLNEARLLWKNLIIGLRGL